MLLWQNKNLKLQNIDFHNIFSFTFCNVNPKNLNLQQINLNLQHFTAQMIFLCYTKGAKGYRGEGGLAMGFIRNLFLRYLHIIAAVALAVTTLTVNSTCLAIIHQEKLPDNALKLRRF